MCAMPTALRGHGRDVPFQEQTITGNDLDPSALMPTQGRGHGTQKPEPRQSKTQGRATLLDCPDAVMIVIPAAQVAFAMEASRVSQGERGQAAD
jgi:hypothetical protein